MASASAIKGVIRLLSKSYTMMGRADADNLAQLEDVQSYRDGYRNDLHARGVKEKRAKVMKESKVRDLVDYLTRQINETEGIAKCVLLMDRAAVLYLWESWARGKECEELESQQIDQEDGLVFSGWSKTIWSEPSGRVELSQRTGEKTFLVGSAELLAKMGLQQISTGWGFLFRLLNASRNAFLDEPLKATAL